MSKVSVSKSLMVIRAIEKYGAFSKKKKSLKKRFRHKLHLGPTDEEEKQAKDQERNERIEEEAQKDHQEQKRNENHVDKQNGNGPVGRHGTGEEHSNNDDDSEDNDSGDVKADMHDGMKKEDMTDQERAERATALIRSAFSKGWKGEQKEILKDAKQNRTEENNGSGKATEEEQETQSDRKPSP